MSAILAKVKRKKVVESIHRGYIAVVNSHNEVIYKKGDINRTTYIRSSAKPIQALNVILSGAYKHFGFSTQELALMCSSHFAEKKHIEILTEIFRKMNLSKDKLKCGNYFSRNEEIALKQASEGMTKSPELSDCSGKHAGFLSVCAFKNYDFNTYLDVNHPVQKNILKIFSHICKLDAKKISIGIDGCSAPVFALPIYNIALGYARLADENLFDTKYKNAINKIFKAFNKFPFMIAGSNGFCTEFNKNTDKAIIGKVGAEGVFCISDRRNKLGIAIKIEDGNPRAIPVVVYRLLKKLKFREKNKLEILEKFKTRILKNNAGIKVGKIEAVF